MVEWWLAEESRRIRRPTVSSATSLTTNITWSRPALNPSLRREKPASSRLRYGSAPFQVKQSLRILGNYFQDWGISGNRKEYFCYLKGPQLLVFSSSHTRHFPPEARALYLCIEIERKLCSELWLVLLCTKTPEAVKFFPQRVSSDGGRCSICRQVTLIDCRHLKSAHKKSRFHWGSC
jgi:hypothetical protein